MNVPLWEHVEKIIRSQVLSGRFASEAEVIEEAIRRLDNEPAQSEATTASLESFQDLQRRLLAAGLISEIRPPIRVDTGTERLTPITVEGESLSETMIRERR